MRIASGITLFAAMALQCASAQAAGEDAEPEFQAGTPLGTVNEAGEVTPLSENVRVLGSFHFAESCTYDSERNLIVVMNAGAPQNVQPNDGYVSLLNPDGTVHTAKWIGASRDGLTLNHPLGSAISDGTLYVADIDTIRMFDLASGEPIGEAMVPEASLLNGIAVTNEGTVYVSNTTDPQRVYAVTGDGDVSIFAEGDPLSRPNGIAVDGDGNIVVVNIGTDQILTFSPEGELLTSEASSDSGNDGIVILEDGTKYVSSVVVGTIARILPGEEPEVIAAGIPSAASICHDPVQNQIIVPMNTNNALAFVPLD